MAQRVLIAVYHMPLKQEPFHDLEASYLDKHHQKSLVKRMCRRIQRLGYKVDLEGKTVYWSGKEYQVSYVRGDLARLILLSLSGDDSGERYTVHPFEIRVEKN